MTPFAVQSALLGIPAQARTPVRLGGTGADRPRAADQIRDELREFAHLGGFVLRPDSTPWFGAALRTPTTGPARVRPGLAPQHAAACRCWPHRLARACEEAGLRPPDGYAEAGRGCCCSAPSPRRCAARSGVFASDPAAAGRRRRRRGRHRPARAPGAAQAGPRAGHRGRTVPRGAVPRAGAGGGPARAVAASLRARRRACRRLPSGLDELQRLLRGLRASVRRAAHLCRRSGPSPSGCSRR